MGKHFLSIRNPRDSHDAALPKPAIGTVGILTTEHGRFSRFWTAFLGEHIPAHTKLIIKMSLNIAEARNEVLRDAEGDWVWFMDDDHTFAPDLLKNLLARNVDIVQPLVLTRYRPFGAVMMGPPTSDGKANWRYALSSSDTGGLKPVNVVGCAGMLIRRRVWEAMEYPYFTMGSIASDVISEDVSFCRIAESKGFKIYTDLDNRMGHLNVGEVWPERLADGTWVTKIIFGNEVMLIPTAAPIKQINHKTGEITDVAPQPESV